MRIRLTYDERTRVENAMLKGEAQDLMDSLLEDNDDDQELDEQHIQEMKKLKLQLLAEHVM